ncbi:rhodanese-like domain-containing protein [Sulfurisoma sediminicola]|uniref:Rhodanese-related sulfurtransferase n=1 Tax=Sulfurisoma sediminicola TaxID=1381557 RepID=A0A497XCA4_9PROT|nr:rhodanese-like domain-containing protein [Sulfurisoma sediminicola]RLJ64563.1 rhodanese-related sulfurtransferase [Sulfurisoma sediminicola]
MGLRRDLLVFAAGLSLAAVAAADQPVGITATLPYVDVVHDGKPFRIEREQDNLNQIEPDYSLTSRPCPPYCIQPMLLAPGVETIGELELLDYLRRAANGEAVVVVDSREEHWLLRTGIIPGAMHLTWTELHPAHTDSARIADTLQFVFGVARTGILWNFENARTAVFYCNGVWCGQSPTNIKQLLALGYPPHKLKWYRGGMQSWKSLGLSTASYLLK